MESKERIHYREMTLEECDRIQEIDASQWIERVWRLVNGEYRFITINYMEDSWPDGYEKYRAALEDTLLSGGVAYVAVNEEGTFVDLATLKRSFFGTTARYLLVDSMFVSRVYRGLGIGKQLFERCAAKARCLGADKLYLCASSAEDTIAFYRRVGCVEAKEINQALYAQDPRDFQMEYGLR